MKDFTMQEPFFQSFFYFSSSGRDFFPHLKVEILEDFTVEKSFSRFVFFFLLLDAFFWGCIFYVKDFTMQNYYSAFFFFYYWERFFSHF